MEHVLFDPIKHEYRDVRGVLFPSVTWSLGQAGLCDFSFVEQEVRERAMERGKSVHWMLQLEDEGALNYRTVPLRLRPFRKAWADWKKASGFVAEMIERPFISHYGYAGTIDRFGRFPNGSHAIVDIKTGNAPVQGWVRYQLVAYTGFIHSVPAIARTVRRIGVALHLNGKYSVKEFPASEWDLDWAIFNEARRRVDAGYVERRGH